MDYDVGSEDQDEYEEPKRKQEGPYSNRAVGSRAGARTSTRWQVRGGENGREKRGMCGGGAGRGACKYNWSVFPVATHTA